MSRPLQTAKQRIALSIYHKCWRAGHRRRAFNSFGAKCSTCGVEESATNDLRFRFIDPNDPLKAKYRTNAVTLHRRLWRQPILRTRVVLLCNICRIERKYLLGNN